jgi:radical SAM protein with 4Fe4S-binding SPASM domain
MLITNEARIETCTLCNHRCIFCPHSTSFKRKKEVMSFNTYKYIIDKLHDEVPEINEVTVSGFGEAFLDPSIINKVEYAVDKGYKVHSVTNGTLLHSIDLLHLMRLVSDIRISLHSLIPDNYIKITGGNEKELELLMKTIEFIIDRKRATHTKLIITVDVIEINQKEVDDLIKFYGDRIDLLEIWKPHNWVNDLNYRKGSIIKNTCGRTERGPLQIQVDGTINMCCFDYNGKLLLGNFLNQTIAEIFNSDAYIDLKKHHKNNTLGDTDYICKDCDQRKDQSGIILYNKFKDRIGRTSTNYARLK